MEIKFICANCGNKVERNLMSGKHAVFGAISALNRETSCCEDPDYRDSEGFQDSKPRKTFRQRILSFA